MSRISGNKRLNIYLAEPELQRKIKVVAAQKGMSVSAYCLQAIRQQLAKDEATGPSSEEKLTEAAKAARRLDELREELGPIGIPVTELIAEGRRR